MIISEDDGNLSDWLLFFVIINLYLYGLIFFIINLTNNLNIFKKFNILYIKFSFKY